MVADLEPLLNDIPPKVIAVLREALPYVQETKTIAEERLKSFPAGCGRGIEHERFLAANELIDRIEAILNSQ